MWILKTPSRWSAGSVAETSAARWTAVVLVLAALVVPDAATAQSGGTLSGVVVATRTASDGDRSFLTEVTTDAAEPVDQVEYRLSRDCDEGVEPELLPPGWTLTQDGRDVTLRGPAQDEDFLLRFDSDDCPPPAEIKYTLSSQGRGIARGKAPVGQLPAVQTRDSLDGIVSLPPVAYSGETITLSVLDEQALPAGGRGSLGGRVLEDAVTETESERQDEESEGITTTPGRWMRTELPDVQTLDSEPASETDSEPLTFTYLDRWGETFVEAEVSEDAMRIVEPPAESATPRIYDCTETTFVARQFCVCGYFPEAEHRRSLLLDGRPLGTPLAASSQVAVFQLSDRVAPGGHTISGRPAAGFPAEDAAMLTVLRILGHLDREELWQAASTEMTLRVEGTDEPVTFQLTNHTPQVISLEGGETQSLATSGGEVNQLMRQVTGLHQGDFHIGYELSGSECPCRGDRPGTTIQDEDDGAGPADPEADSGVTETRSAETGEVQEGEEEPADAKQNQPPCTVEIEGQERLCHSCEDDDDQERNRFQAKGTPRGGRCAWEVTDGAGRIRQRPSRCDLSVWPLRASEKKDDVQVTVTYTVGAGSCQDSQQLTVVEPSSLRVRDLWMGTVSDNHLQTVEHDGVPVAEGPLPKHVQGDLTSVLQGNLPIPGTNRTRKLNANDVGSILLVYYEVLDQFGDLWQCDGDLTEEITPDDRVTTGGTEIEDGRAEDPDRIFWFALAGQFEDLDLEQTIEVSGCEVRQNRITIRETGVDFAEGTD